MEPRGGGSGNVTRQVLSKTVCFGIPRRIAAEDNVCISLFYSRPHPSIPVTVIHVYTIRGKIKTHIISHVQFNSIVVNVFNFIISIRLPWKPRGKSESLCADVMFNKINSMEVVRINKNTRVYAENDNVFIQATLMQIKTLT